MPEPQTIELDCPPGLPRPGELIAGIVEGTGLSLRTAKYKFMGHWIWDYSDVPAEQWQQVQPILKARIETLYEQGIIRFGSW